MSFSSFAHLPVHAPGSVLVPTMGALHDAHLSLIHLAATISSHVVVTIFVNPAQFAPNEDLAKYPRTLERDLDLIRTVQKETGVRIDVYHPAKEDFYRENEETFVTMSPHQHLLEGTIRPTFFRGVLTIITKLLNLVRPDILILGQKDAQQFLLVRQMVKDLFIPCHILMGPTLREKDGLAMSSRNVFLTSSEREVVPLIYQTLLAGQRMLGTSPVSADSIKKEMMRLLAPLPADVQYISLSDYATLQELGDVTHDTPFLLSLAVKMRSGVRLIDNLMIHPPSEFTSILSK